MPRRYDAAMDRRLALAVFRAVTAIVVIAAIAYQVVLNVDSGLFRPLRFFAFFTILSNVFGAILWLWLAATLAARADANATTSSAGRRPSTSW